ncbi:MAG: NTP transferase domain-containing protein [Acidimicrobiales bacterium]|nr:NTP transferase domain-containing protein [Acidimicrobiales bacterium]
MAGGEGSRLRPLTSHTPKPMLPLVNRPMMEHIVGLLRSHGFDEIVVTVAFLANQIRAYFGDGSEFGVSITYATEEQPLGTAGSVRNAKDVLDERFLVISGDVLTDIDLTAIVKRHEEASALATIGLVAVDDPVEFGIVITREDGSIERFLEKPTWGQVFSDTINTGIFVLEPDIFDLIAPDRPVDFSEEVFPQALAEGRTLIGAVAEGYWEDVGTLDAYVRAHHDVLDGTVVVDVPGFRLRDGVWLGDGAEVHPEAEIRGSAVIGAGCRVEAGARLGPYAVLGRNTRVRRDALVERSVVHENVYVGESARVRGAVIGRSSELRRASRCDEGSVLGHECFVGDEAVVGAGVKVYPFKTIEAGATVNSSIILESRGARSLFGRSGVSGLANVDMTPELATRIAMAWATSLPRGTTVVTSRDSSRAARMLKRALMSGLNAGGVDVLDLEVASVPVTRFAVRQPQATGGLTVRLDRADPDSVGVRFLDRAGLDISEAAQRKIERQFTREDFRRVPAEEIGDIGFPPRVLEHYTTALGQTVDLDVVRSASFKIVVDYAYGSTSFTMPTVLGQLGADVLAVNPYASTQGAIGFTHRDGASAASPLVTASGAHLGAVLDPDGERLAVIDDEGHVLSDTELLLAFVHLVAPHIDGDRIAVPVNATGRVADMIEGAAVRLVEAKTSPAALMATAAEDGIGFAADTEGGFILPGFMPAFDAAAALVKLLELLARHDVKLSSVVAGLPRSHVAHETVVTPWEQKGLIMRSLVETTSPDRLVLVDGVKVLHDDGWALALPDATEPVTHVWAEAATDAEARARALEYGRRVRQLMR